MSIIKKFFEKKKLDVKFKKAGSGHKLTEESQPSSSKLYQAGSLHQSRVVPPAASHEAQKRAAEAALARVEAAQHSKHRDPMKIMRLQAKQELEAEKIRAGGSSGTSQSEPVEVVQDAAPVLPAVLFTCPEVSSAVLPKNEVEGLIEQFLLTNLADEPEMTSALMIHTLNKDKEKVKTGVETIIKYLDNIISNPKEEKFHKIKLSNKVFQERVASLKGYEEFLQAAGFNLVSLPVDDHEEQFFFLPEEMAADVERLEAVKSVLLAAEPIKPQLYRDVRVFYPSTTSANKFDVPDEFFNITPEELKREQLLRDEAVEKMGMLRTKAMRERDQLRELRRYRYTLIRARFPDGFFLQGTFRATEKLTALLDFIRENLECEWMPFTLTTAIGKELTDETQTLAELGLTPAVLLNFSFDPTVAKEVAAQLGASSTQHFLKKNLLAKAKEL